MTHTLEDELRELIRDDPTQVLVIAGTGVSIAAVKGSSGGDVASWGGLLHSGIKECERLYARDLPRRWSLRQQLALRHGDLDEWLGVAELVSRKLKAPGPDFAGWLEKTVGNLRTRDFPANQEVPQGLKALARRGVLLATTNYDDIVAEAAGLRPITWQEPGKCEAALKGKRESVLHLHGHWDRPESVILGVRSYEMILGNEQAQAIQRLMGGMKTLIFVGFGQGLADPNFGALLEWAGRAYQDSRTRHYRLYCDAEEARIRANPLADRRVKPIRYGEDHRKLGGFLSSLAPTI